jgi:large subunit ribosomal protein L35
MPKIKTKKAVSKRIKITKTGKVMKRTAGQGHFNARESGKVKRNKRRDSEISKADQKNIKSLMPYN